MHECMQVTAPSSIHCMYIRTSGVRYTRDIGAILSRYDIYISQYTPVV